MTRPRPPRRVRLLLANLHATSNPLLVVPWLLAVLLSLRVDVVLLQEVTGRHARLLRHLPRWELVRNGDEAILGRRRLLTDPGVLVKASSTWRGHHTGADHAPRTIPSALVRGWLRVVSVHYPPAWEAGPDDRRQAGVLYMATLEDYLASMPPGPLLAGGDWNALKSSPALRASWRHGGLRAYGAGIDYVAASEAVKVTRWRRIGRGPGMDHDAVLVVAHPRMTPLTSKAPS